MARTATPRRSQPRRSPTASAKKAASKGKAAPTKVAAKGGRTAAKAVAPTPKWSGPSKLAAAAARKVFKAAARRAVRAGRNALENAADRAAGAGKGAVERKRLPIQVGIDLAVPLSFAWDEWMTFDWLTEGIHRIDDVERDDEQLFGQTSGARSTDWAADVVDERDQQSFAWRSTEGSDCAGLMTVHRLSERLTRIELDLDVLPSNPAQAASLATGLARRRAENELRRFKAHVEFINPDIYETEPEPDEEPDEEQAPAEEEEQ